MKKILLSTAIIAAAALSGCAGGSLGYSEFKEGPITNKFTVNASLMCLYEKGVLDTALDLNTGLGAKSFVNRQEGRAWFQYGGQTTIKLRSLSPDVTEVTRQAAPPGSAWGYGEHLIEYLKSNPCAAKAS